MQRQRFNRPLVAALVLLVAGAATGCGTTVRPGYIGLKYIALDDPGLQKKQRADGFYWQWPWNDIVTYDVRFQSRDEKVRVLTKDDLHVETTVTVTYRPDPAQVYALHTRIGPRYYDRVIRPLFMTLARTEFSRHKHNDLAKHSNVIEQHVLASLKKRLGKLPLQVRDVSVKHIVFDSTVTDSISRKLAMEQKAKQKRYELLIARQDAEIARTNARGVSDAIRIRAEGEGRATVIKGRAQAEAQRAIDETLTKKYLQYKAFDGKSTRYYFVPVGKNGMPLIVNTGRH